MLTDPEPEPEEIVTAAKVTEQQIDNAQDDQQTGALMDKLARLIQPCATTLYIHGVSTLECTPLVYCTSRT